jgi:hypothetical protein
MKRFIIAILIFLPLALLLAYGLALLVVRFAFFVTG